MTTKQDFTSDEWQLLLDLPVLAGFLVSVASESGPIGTLQEIWQSVAGPAQAARERPASPLVQALEAELEHPAATDESVPSRVSAATGDADSPEQFRAQVLEKCRAASAILVAKATPDEADAYRTWVVEGARSVAAAAKEGGFLGIGGRRVSPEESAVVAEIAEALGLPPNPAPTD